MNRRFKASWFLPLRKDAIGVSFQGRRTNKQDLGPEEQTCFQGPGPDLVFISRNNSKADPELVNPLIGELANFKIANDMFVTLFYSFDVSGYSISRGRNQAEYKVRWNEKAIDQIGKYYSRVS